MAIPQPTNTSESGNLSELEENFFAGFSKWDELKWLYIIFHLVETFTGPMLMYCIVWYENNACGSHYRTLINTLLVHICQINVVRIFVARIPYVVAFAFSPLPKPVCDGIIILGRFFFLCVMTEIVLWQLVKYLYVFHWCRITVVSDNFVSSFTTMVNFVMSALVVFVAFAMGYNNAETDYHICTGNNPLKNIHQTPFLIVSNSSQDNLFNEVSQCDPLFYYLKFMFIILVFLTGRVWLFSKKDEIVKLWNSLITRKPVAPQVVIFDNMTSGQNNSIQKTKTIIGETGSLVAVILTMILLVPSVISKSYATDDINSLNHGYGRTWMYISKMSMPILFDCVLPLVLIVGSPKMRKSIWKGIQQLVGHA